MPNSNIVPGISNPSKDIVVFRQGERPTVVERTRPAFWYNTSNSGTYFWDTKLDDWVPVSAFGTTTTTTTAGPLDTCLTEWDITPPLVVPYDYEFVSVLNSPTGGYLVFLQRTYFAAISGEATLGFYTCFYNKYSRSWGEPNELTNSDNVYGLLNNQPYVFSYPLGGRLDCWGTYYGQFVKNGQKIKTVYENYNGAGTKLGFDENGSLYISAWGSVDGNNKFIAVMNDPSQFYVPSFVFYPSTDSILFGIGGDSGYITHMRSGYFTNYELKKYVGDEAYTIKQVGGYASPFNSFVKILGGTNGIFHKNSKSIFVNPNFSSSSKAFNWKFIFDATTGTSFTSMPSFFINDATTTTYSDIILAANGRYLYQLQSFSNKFVWTPRDIGFDANWEKVIALGSSDIFLQAKTSDGYIIARSSCVPAVTTTTTTTTLPPCGSDWIPSTSSLNLKASWNQIVAFRSVLYLYHIENQYLYVSESIDGIKWSDRKIAISGPCKSTTIIKVIATRFSVCILGDKNEFFESKNSLGSSFSFYDAGNVYNSTLYRYTRVEVVDIFDGGDFGVFALGKNNRIFLIQQFTTVLYEFAYANYNFTSITSNPYKFSAFIQIQSNAPSGMQKDTLLYRTGLCDDNRGGLLIGPDKSVITDSMGQTRIINGADSTGTTAFTSGQWIELPPMDSKIIVYGNGNYVILYKNNTISYSENALNWATKAIPAGKWNNLLFLNGYFILIGLGKSIYISKTLQENSWQERTVVDSGDWYGVVFSYKLFISSVYPDKVMWKVSNCFFDSVPETIPCNTYTTLYQCPFNDCIECVCGGSTGEFATLLECQGFLYSQRSARCPYPSPPAATTTTTSTTTTTTTTFAPTTTTLAPTKNAPDAVSVLFGLPYLSKFDQNTQAPLTDIRLGFTYLGSSSNIETNGTLSITTSDPEFYVGVQNQSSWSKTSKSPNVSWIPGYGAYSFSTNDYRDLQLIVYWTGNNPSVFDNNATYSITLTFSVLLANGTTITTTGVVNLKRDASVAYQVISGYSDPVTFNNMLNMGSFTTENLNNPTLIIEADKYTVTTNPINVFVIDKNGIVANNFNIDENYNIYPSSYFELIVGGTWWTVPEATTAPNSFTSGNGIRIPIVNGMGTIPSFTIALSSQYREGSWRKTLSGENVATGKEYIQTFFTSYNISPSSSSVSVNFNTFALPVIVRYTEPMECTAGLISFDGKLTHVPIVNGGFGYGSAPEIRIVGGGGEGAEGTAVVYNGIIRSITITNQGSGYTSRPTVMASNSICPECPPVTFPTCPPGLDCLQTNYNYSGLCPASYSCIPCPTTTTTTTTTTLDPNFPLATCQVPASSFAISFISSTNVSSSTFPEMELNSDGYFPLGKIKFDFYHTENDLGTLWRGYNCATKSVRVDIHSVTVKTSHPDFIVTNGISKSNQVKNLSYPDCGISYVAPGWFESIFYCVHWIGSDPSIFTGSNPIELVLTFEIKVNSFTDGTEILNSGYIATLTQYV